MRKRLHHIAIHNFKAFRKFDLQLGGRHLLVYGANGSGKSSLYWALYTFLQSARKPKDGITKYFDPTSDEHLLNIYEQSGTSPTPGEITLTLRHTTTETETAFRINRDIHGTFKQPMILKGNLASDFITYRFLFGFSNFRNSQNFNLWPLFVKEILPFCVSTNPDGVLTPYDRWKKIESGEPNPHRLSGIKGKLAYDNFKLQCKKFERELEAIIDKISHKAQKFYDQHFSKNDPETIQMKLGLTQPPSFEGQNLHGRFHRPKIGFKVKIDDKVMRRPQSFLNEAKLTQLALSVRFAASLINLHKADLKLLVLDDLLVSLDMSNRMKVVDILLSGTFDNYQKIILTHDLGFFREFRRCIDNQHTMWRFVELQGNAAESIDIKSCKTHLQKAESYLAGHDLEEAALFLRKAAEEEVKHYHELINDKTLSTSKFTSLSKNLIKAKNILLQSAPNNLYKQVLKGTKPQHRKLLLSKDVSDIENNTNLTDEDKTTLKSKRSYCQIWCMALKRRSCLIDR